MAEHSKALYREWRPQTFDELVGQKQLTDTLRQAAQSQDLAHAYLFCGTRGTGKTSMAKIFSRAINCEHPDEKGNPCNQCATCQGILSGSLLDVIEMDAASNNSVDDVRHIIEEVHYLPSLAKYKVYIIDEAHMLSTAAFNALLKTLEEPPAHVIFILATTDPQRLPATILSRCQRYDFRRIRPEEMQAHLSKIAQAIHLSIEADALAAIVHASDGAMRDAISLLDQCHTLHGEQDQPMSRADVLTLIGQVSDDLLLYLMKVLARKDVPNLFRCVEEIATRGIEYSRFVSDLAIFYRHLLLLKAGGQEALSLLPVPRETGMNIARFLPYYGMEELLSLIRDLVALSLELKVDRSARMGLEIGLLALMQKKVSRPSEAATLEQKKKTSPETSSS